MKTCIMVLLTIITGYNNLNAQTWSEWFRQKKTQTKYSLLQIAKLQIYLNYVKSGYQVAKGGLTLIGDIKDGDFKLHDLYFTDLRRVKSTVRNYSKVSQIQTLQRQILADCEKQRQYWNSPSSYFTNDERILLQKRQDKLLTALSDDISALDDVLTNGNLELTDDERLRRIDEIYVWVSDKKKWTQSQGKQYLLLNTQRRNSLHDFDVLKRLH